MMDFKMKTTVILISLIFLDFWEQLAWFSLSYRAQKNYLYRIIYIPNLFWELLSWALLGHFQQLAEFFHCLLHMGICMHMFSRQSTETLWVADILWLYIYIYIYIHMGCPESFRTFKIARHCVDLAGRGKCYSLVMSLTNCVPKTALPYLA